MNFVCVTDCLDVLCDDGECVSGILCDGQFDCVDFSDESQSACESAEAFIAIVTLLEADPTYENDLSQGRWSNDTGIEGYVIILLAFTCLFDIY